MEEAEGAFVLEVELDAGFYFIDEGEVLEAGGVGGAGDGFF